jgi:hypothetical protein
VSAAYISPIPKDVLPSASERSAFFPHPTVGCKLSTVGYQPSPKSRSQTRTIESDNISRNPSRINTCESVSKQTTLSTFRMNTYAKPRGRGQLSLTKSRDSRALSRSKVRSLFCAFLHSANQERFTTPLQSSTSALFSKTAGWGNATFQPATFQPSTGFLRDAYLYAHSCALHG